MSVFSEEWLRLREPADAAARNRGLAEKLAASIAGRGTINFIDLGCGTGANLRYTALAIPPGVPQHWRLLDYDPNLLIAAGENLRQWADRFTEAGNGIRLEKEGREIDVTFCRADLFSDIEAVLSPGEITTASAFFDLVSSDWIIRFAKAAANVQAVVYASLTYNGLETWSPLHPADAAMLAAFHVDQRRDKGFGAASGPDAALTLQNALAAEGYSVDTGESPWKLGEDTRQLLQELAEGSAAAVAELKLFDEEPISGWTKSRRDATSCVIGHTDLLAFPPD